MAWQVKTAKKIKLNNTLVAAEVVLDNGLDEADPDYKSEKKRWGYDADTHTPAEFRTMLIGAGTLAAPEGEIGAWINHYNANDPNQTTEEDL